ncbi:NUDIX hydrolase [bacterium]|nr:NUDIX hydrolase [bacterium]
MSNYRNPYPTVDIIIELLDDNSKIVLIERHNEPLGVAIPGGFVDYGESLESAAVREAKEETNLDITLLTQLKTYSNPTRDPRFHTVSTVFIATANGVPKAGDDAKSVIAIEINNIPENMVFDHKEILEDYVFWKRNQKFPSYTK